MNEQAQRIAIAELVGWKIINGHSVISPEGCHYDFMRWETVVPDYLYDLNAAIGLCDLMHVEGYSPSLHMGSDGKWACAAMKNMTMMHWSTSDTLAANICQCFLRIKGKWTDQ